MLARRRAIRGRISLWGGSRAVVHPDGNFDIDVLIDEIAKVEALALKPSKIFLAPEQYDAMIKEMSSVGISYRPDQSYTIFGLPVQVDETKKHCLGIIEEF